MSPRKAGKWLAEGTFAAIFKDVAVSCGTASEGLAHRYRTVHNNAYIWWLGCVEVELEVLEMVFNGSDRDLRNKHVAFADSHPGERQVILPDQCFQQYAPQLLIRLV